MVLHYKYQRSKLLLVLFICSIVINISQCQLPDDIQQELEKSIAEQARIDALRRQQQQQQQQKGSGKNSRTSSSAGPPVQQHDPNNYSYQQVSPPIQYSYYQPFGDAAQPPQQQQQQQQPVGPQQRSSTPSGGQTGAPINIDLNNFNFDIPSSPASSSNGRQAAASQQHLTPSFTGAGGLPVLKPISASRLSDQQHQADNNQLPVGQAPLAPQARVQQGPPLTEADFKDITGGENYGAPGGSDFGLGDATQNANNANNNNNNQADNTDSQLREFGMPTNNNHNNRRRIDVASQQMNIPDFGAFGPIGMGAGNQQQQQRPQQRQGSTNDLGGFGNFGDFASEPSGVDALSRQQQPAAGAEAEAESDEPAMNNNNINNNNINNNNEFDFGGKQPNSMQRASNNNDPSSIGNNGGAPASLQSLLGSSFPGLGGGGVNGGSNGLGGSGDVSNMNLDEFAQGGNNPQQQQQNSRQRNDDGALDIANLGDKSDQFSGADLGGFEQPSPQNDQDYNYGAASNQQPKSVPYPDANPQPVGTLLALAQPQTLTQTRYNPQPDHGTYQDYPAYSSGGNDFSQVREVVDGTPRARPAGPGRYSTPSANELAPEYRESLYQEQQLGGGGGGPTTSRFRRAQQFDYSQPPTSNSNEEEEDFNSENSYLSKLDNDEENDV